MRIVAVGVIIAVVISFVHNHGLMALAYRTDTLPLRQVIGRSLEILTAPLSSTELQFIRS